VGLSSPGIGSNLDVNSIVTQLMTVESQPLTSLAKKEASYQARISAFGSLSGALGAFQSAVATLSNPAKFQSVTAATADATIATATATTMAPAGTYAIEVTKLAQAQTIATKGQLNTTNQIGDGVATTLTFSFGSISGGKLADGVYSSDPTATPPDAAFAQDANQASGSVVIDSSNNSLQGIRDAINKAALGVTATIVSDGGATPNHLVLTSNKTGASSNMKVSVTREPAADPAKPAQTALSDLLAYDPAPTGKQNMTQSSAGQDTALTVNGFAVTAANKSVQEAIQGVTINVSKIGATTITVARDTSSIQAGVSSLVKAYNDLDKTIKTLTSYDPTTKAGGPLLGESSVQSIQAQIRKTLSNAISGSGGLSSLSQVGVGFQKDGTLALDMGKLQSAMTSNFSDMAGLFASTGTATDSLISFVSSTDATKAGNSAVNVTALATRGGVTGSAAPANLTIAEGQNDQLAMTVNGVTATVKLTPGNYTAASLMAQVQSAINGAPAFSAAAASVSLSADASGKISITSNKFGSASNVIVSGNGAHNLLGADVATGTPGINVAGTINGVTATGSGQTLSGAAGSAAEGLVLQVAGGQTGARGMVAFSTGYASLLNKLVGTFVGTGGMITSQTDGLQSTIKNIGTTRDSLNAKLAGIEKRYRTQFTALDVALGKMTTTSTFLTQQLASISSVSRS
jgi:flagellar hook-associated protein 2